MPVARLLAIVALCLSSAFAQQQPSASNGASGDHLEDYNSFASPAAATPREPWRIIPEQRQTDSSAPSPNAPLSDQAGANDLAETVKRMVSSAESDSKSRTFRFTTPDEKLMTVTLPPGDSEGPACYTIHSYVVARDSKDSDAVHPVSESTCQPASRYGVHTAEHRVRLSNGEDSR